MNGEALLVSIDQVVRYRDGPGGATSPGLVLKISGNAMLIEENFRFITPQRKWISVDDVVEVLRELPRDE